MGCGGVRGCAGNGDGEGCVAGAPSGRADIGLPARWQNVGRRVERRRAEGIANPSACGSRTRRFFSGWFPASGSGPKFRVVAPALAVRDTAQDRQSGELWILASGQPSYPDAGLDSAGYQGRQQPGDLQLPKRCAVCGGFTRRQEVAYSVGAVEWNVLEISVPEGRVRTIVGGGGIFWEPDWAPSGTHFLFTNWGSSPHAIEDRSAADGFSRRVAEAPEGKYSAVNSARWAPDGTRFLFTQRAGLSQKQLMVADAAGGHRTALAELNDTSEGTYAWSPDSQWIVFQRAVGGKAGLSVLGCGHIPGRPGPGPQVARPEQVLDFAVLYKTNCSACHGDKGKNGAAIALANPVYLAVIGEDNLREITSKGVGGKLMPAFARSAGGPLTDQQISILAHGMMQQWNKPAFLSTPGTPTYRASQPGDPVRGEQAYGQFCASCHGAHGEGMTAAINGKKTKVGSIVDERSEERRVGKESRSRWSPYHYRNMH